MAKENAVVYARYSSRNQTEQSIEGQLAAAYKYAEQHDYKIIKEYCDRAKTGTNDNRQAFQQMLTDSSKKQFSVIIVWKIDRFGRNREEIIFNRVRAKKNGVRIEYVAENVPEGPEGVIMEAVMEGMAEYYSLQLSQNVRRGLEEVAKKHHVIGGRTPFGYKKNENKEYEIVPEEAEIVKHIFEKYSAGQSMNEVAAWLNDNGYTTRDGNKFKGSGLTSILSNERYIGVYKWADFIREENIIPPIIDRMLFDHVQERLKENKHSGNSRFNKTGYSLSGKLYCGLCGKQMYGCSGYGRHGGKYSYYNCYGRKKKLCEKRAVKKLDVETSILNEILNLLNDDELIDYIALLTWKYYKKHDGDTTQIDNLRKELAGIRRKIDNIVKSIEDGAPYSTVEARLKALESDEEAVVSQITSIELKPRISLTEDHIRYFLYKLRDRDYSDPNCQKRLIDTFVNRILLYEDKAVIALNYSGEYNSVTVEGIQKANDSQGVRLLNAYQGNAREKRTLKDIKLLNNVFIIELPICKTKKI